MTAPARHQYCFRGFRLDPVTRELSGPDGVAVPLTSRAFELLLQLIEHRGQLLGKDQLLAAVWPGRVVEENNLTQAVSALRKALGSGAGDHRYIVTVPGRGYRFVAEVSVAEVSVTDVSAAEASVAEVGDGGTAPRAGPEKAVPATTAAARTPGWRGAFTLGALLFVLALVAIAAWRVHESPPAAQLPPPQTALAVLPFRSLSSGPRDELLELGLAETLITRLGRSDALRVRSLASAQQVADAQQDALAAGRRLGAAYVVEGSTQQVGDRVRVNARLLSVAKGGPVWAGTFDARIERVFTLQDEIAGAVTSALALQPITVPAHSRSACDGGDPQAFRAWLRGYYLLQRPSHGNLLDALAAFRSALDLDPACTRAYAGMALAYRGLVHTDRDPREMFPLAKAAVAQALRIDPGSAEALMAQGRNQHLYDWDWAGAEASFKRAIEINPSLMEAHFAYAHLLVDLGRYEEGLSHARQARALDPLSPMINTLEAGFLTAARRPDAAGVQLQRALELRPDFWIALLVRGGMALDRGDTAAAIADLTRAAERSERTSQVLAVLAIAYSAAGERAPAQAILRELQARDAAGYVPATSLAAVHNALGDTRAALDLLERAYRERDIRMAFLKVDARWNNLRAQPRFRALAQRMGLQGGQANGRY